MKRVILCEVCKHQACTFNFLLHRKTMMCLVRPGVIAEQVICRAFDERSLVASGAGAQKAVAK